MSPTIEDCLANARRCEQDAAQTKDQAERKRLLREARDWNRLAAKKGLDVTWAAGKKLARGETPEE